MFELLKRILVGRPLASTEEEHQKLPKTSALAIFSSDAISSTAYATEEILFVTALGASSLALGLSRLVPIAAAVAILLVIVIISYRQTVYAYPTGGGSYRVSKDHLGRIPSLVAGASLLIDYILGVAVATSAGVAAIVSIPAFRGLVDQRVVVGLAFIALITTVNLRGLKESSTLFAFPTYGYIVIVGALIIYGLIRSFAGDLDRVPFDADDFEGVRETGGQLGLFLILKGFSSGAVALTGIEAISDGVPAFRKPASKNAAITLVFMGLILGSIFFGVSVLAHRLHPFPSHDETVFSQLGRAVFGEGPMYLVLQLLTAAILVLAANTAFADFPRLASIIAADGFLPRWYANRGDRLVFSNGILFLGASAGALLIAFGGKTNALIPLYAVGVFTSFTLSQAGMARRNIRLKEPGWRPRAAISCFGAAVTLTVGLVVAVTKFTSGAWVPLVVVPAFIGVFLSIRKHYVRVDAVLAITPAEVRPEKQNHTVVVLVPRIHRGVLKALNYARSLRPNHLAAVYVSFDEADQEHMQRQWEEFGIDVTLEIVASPYRDLVRPVERYLDELDQRWNNDTITVVVPEYVMNRIADPRNLLHGQSALAIKAALLIRPNTVVTSVPYNVDHQGT